MRPPVSARSRTVTKAMTMRMFRLLKNLNIAPSTGCFEPAIDLVHGFFFDDAVADHLRDLIERRNRIRATLAGFGKERCLVVVTDLVVGGPQGLAETDLEELIHSQAAANSV